MHEIAFDLLILLAGIWLVAITLRPLGLPTVMGELIVGVLVGPAVLGLIEPNEFIELLAELGIFFLMFHAGVETQPVEFYDALKRSLGVAIVGAIVPFLVSFGVAKIFGLGWVGATFVGLTMTATAVVITLKSLKDLGLSDTRVARVIVASCVIDDLLTLVFFGLIIGMLSGGSFEPLNLVITVGKVVVFFGVAVLMGRYIYPRLTLPFRSEGGKGFTFVLLVAFAAGLFAEAIGLHMILGAYLAGLFFEEKVAHPRLVEIVVDRAYGIAYSFLGPIFFISLGFSITFDISFSEVKFLALLTLAVIIGQILSAGAMALRMGLPPREALTVGVGMCGRAELAFILASLALSQGAIDNSIFSVLIFTAFLLNLFTPLALKGCSELLAGEAVRQPGATRGVVQIDKFDEEVADPLAMRLRRVLPEIDEGVVIYGYGPEVESLLSELESRQIPALVIEESESVAHRLYPLGLTVVEVAVTQEDLDLQPICGARALVLNGEDDQNALLALSAREQGFTGTIVAMISDPDRRDVMLLAGASAAFTPSHILAAHMVARASARVNPRVTGVQPPDMLFEVAELRIHEDSPLAHNSLADMRLRSETGVNVVGQWRDDKLDSPPDADQELTPGMILVVAGTPGNIRRLSEMARPITREGPLVILGYGNFGQKLAKLLIDAGEEVCVIDSDQRPGVDVVGDVLDVSVLGRAPLAVARAILLALESDYATRLATEVVRSYAPDVLIIAGLSRLESVEPVQQAGADFALSLSQVVGHMLSHYVLGEILSLQPRIKVVRIPPGPLVGRHPLHAGIREATGCSIVAVERHGQILIEYPADFQLAADDVLYVCGTANALNLYYKTFPRYPG
jgi:Kef-type K+ transport system membrane component KefB/Trk K+ transport system NAD-binding subunit